MPNVAVVEDDAELRLVLKRGLRAAGFGVTLAGTGGELLAAAERSTPDAFVVDTACRTRTVATWSRPYAPAGSRGR